MPANPKTTTPGPARRGPKPLPLGQLRTHCVSVRLSAAELADLDSERGACARGEHLRFAAFGALRPKIPAINQAAWESLARALSNLNQLAWYANTSGGVAIAELTEEIRDLRDKLHGIKEGFDESDGKDK